VATTIPALNGRMAAAALTRSWLAESARSARHCSDSEACGRHSVEAARWWIYWVFADEVQAIMLLFNSYDLAAAVPAIAHDQSWFGH
jgi:hypothetical protein